MSSSPPSSFGSPSEDERRQPAALMLCAQPWVAHLVDAGEHKHEAEHRDAEREAWKEERPPFALEHGRVDLCPVDRDAPARRRHVAEPEELETGVHEQGDVEDEHER